MNGSAISTSRSQSTEPSVAVARAKVLAGCYRKDDAADPETYAMAVAAVLSEYSPDIVQRVTDPRSGLPSRMQWLPSVKEVRDACEELDARRRSHDAREKQIAEQLAARKSERLNRAIRPSYDELKATYGQNWGMSPPEDDSAGAARRAQALKTANQRLFAHECRAAGMPEDSPVSPSLVALIKAGMA